MRRISLGGEWDRVLLEGPRAAAQRHEGKNCVACFLGVQSSEETKGQEAKGSDAKLKHPDLLEGQRGPRAGPLALE